MESRIIEKIGKKMGKPQMDSEHYKSIKKLNKSKKFRQTSKRNYDYL